MGLIPPIGCSGLFKLLPPFTNVVDTDISYTCMAVRKISDILAIGGNPFKSYYEPYQLTESQYEVDANSGVCIISLQSSSGIWVYIPSSYIESYPQVNGIPYVSVALMVMLGALPDSLNLSYIKNKIISDTQSILGLTPIVQTVVTSPTSLISQDNHMLAEQARQNAIGTTSTDYSEIVSLRSQNQQLLARIAELETYIAGTL